ncbi:MAG TPA: CaiB/BaiF CoA-transferase family protein [Acidimicrobiales bacterium]|nr:CaiB/BaiF CoA-transferase family protein [Acidimicrobiales bacterium]
MTDRPLSDVRVVDLTVARAGPTCVRQLGDWGADVIRVEPPGDLLGLGVGRHTSDFQNLHRNKRSITLNLKEREGLELLYRLVDSADVLVENMRPAVKHRLGFDYETLHERNPRLVYGSISGFGQDGPYAERGGVDQVAQGMGGLMSVTGLPATEPTRVGIPVADLSAGLYLAIGILVALHDRDRTGEGRWVQTSLLEAMIAMMDLQAARYTVEGTVAVQEGNHHPTSVPMGCFRSADGYVNVAGPSGRLLRHFCDAIGLPDLPNDARFDSNAKRSANRQELNRIIGKQLRTRTTSEWVDILSRVKVPCGPVLRMDEVFADPQVQHLKMAATVESPELGPIAILRNAVTMTASAATVRSASPAEGEHTESVLTELGLTVEEIEALRERQVI